MQILIQTNIQHKMFKVNHNSRFGIVDYVDQKV